MLTERRVPLFLQIEGRSALDLPRQPERNDPASPSRIEIELSDGCLLRMDEGVSVPALRRVLKALRG